MQAKQQLILRRNTHLDSLVDKLKEDRVKRIVHTIIILSEKGAAQIKTIGIKGFCVLMLRSGATSQSSTRAS